MKKLQPKKKKKKKIGEIKKHREITVGKCKS